MTKKQKTIVLAVIAIVVVLAVVVVIVGALFVRSLFNNEPMNEAAANKSFQEVRARFGGAEPVVDLRPDGSPVLVRTPPDTQPAGTLKTIHIMRWSGHEERMTRIELPLAFLRMQNSPIRLQVSPDDSGFKVSTSLRVSDIERFGAALLVDDTLPDGAHVLVWSD